MIIIGDIHSCAIELERIIKENPNQEYVSVGDTFDRGQLGDKVWELIHQYKIKAVMGNHEYKLLSYLKGERSNLPWHYYVFLDKFAKRYKITDLILYLENLPYLIHSDNIIISHGAINIENPSQPDLFINVFGKIDESKKVPKNPKRGWWNDYDKNENPFVCYGHVVFDKPNLMKNSLGLDTGACHGGGLSYYNTETKEIKTVESKDYFRQLKQITPIVRHKDQKIN